MQKIEEITRLWYSARDDIKEIERQFADALFILGRRISEGRSPEWACHLL